MKKLVRFMWRTLIGGVLFLVPLIALLVLVNAAVRLIGRIVHPIASSLPIAPHFGLAASELVAIILLILLGFLAGLLAQTSGARRLRDAVEQLVLSKVPGYTLFKSIAEGATGEQESNLKVALANIDDAWLIGFIVEEHPSGLLTVFIPSAPTPTAGSIYFLTEQQVKRLDASVTTAVKCVTRLGVGSRELLESKPIAGKPQADA